MWGSHDESLTVIRTFVKVAQFHKFNVNFYSLKNLIASDEVVENFVVKIAHSPYLQICYKVCQVASAWFKKWVL